MITGNQIPSLMESYTAVYNDDLRIEFEEQNQINDFLVLVEALVEEGYDLSEYTYDELYENCISENIFAKGLLSLLRGGGRALAGSGRALAAGAKPAIKGVLSGVGRAAVPVGIAALIDSIMTGSKGAQYVGAGFNKAREALHNLPSPEEAEKGLSKLGQDVSSFLQRPSKTSETGDSSGAAKPSSGNPLGLQKESYDVYNVVAGYLIEEGYVDNVESAFAIAENMSDEWIQSILNLY